MHIRLPSLACLVLATAATTPLAGQSAQRWSLQASGLVVGVLGKAYDGLATGYGGEVQVRLTPGLWSWGAGAQYSTHGLTNIAGQSVALQGVFIEPRRVFDIGSAKYAPYLSARGAWLQQSAELEIGFASTRRTGTLPSLRTGGVALQTSPNSSELTASGFQANVGGGVLARLSPRVNLDLGVTVGVIRFGDAKLTIDGSIVESFGGTSGTGQNIVARAGLAIGLGKGPAKKAAPAPARPATRPRR